MTTIQIFNTVLAAAFLLCYAYQPACLPIALLKKRPALPGANFCTF